MASVDIVLYVGGVWARESEKGERVKGESVCERKERERERDRAVCENVCVNAERVSYHRRVCREYCVIYIYI